MKGHDTILCALMSGRGQESVRGIATPYELDGTGIVS
jgi:hypothetical protein